jgi:phage gp29-like protein
MEVTLQDDLVKVLSRIADELDQQRLPNYSFEPSNNSDLKEINASLKKIVELLESK